MCAAVVVVEGLEPRLSLSVTDVDATFGSGGTVTPALSVGAYAGVTLGTDGDLLVYGNTPQRKRSTGPFYANVADVAPDGNVRWVGSVPFGGRTGFNLTPTAAARQPDGRVVVAIEQNFGSGTDTFLARLNADGTADRSFPVDYGTHAVAQDVTALSAAADGTITVALSNHSGAFTLQRLSGTNGAILISYPADASLAPTVGSSAVVTGVVQQSDGKIIAAGYTATPGTRGRAAREEMFLVRYKDDGELDSSFGPNGELMTRLRLEPRTITIDPSGREVMLAAPAAGSGTTPYVVAVTPAAQLDATFGTGGAASLAGQLDAASSLAVAPDGTLLIAGTRGGQPAVVRLAVDGSAAQAAMGSNVQAGGWAPVAVMPDGKLILQPSSGVFTRAVGLSQAQPTRDHRAPVAALGRIRSAGTSFVIPVNFADDRSGVDAQTVVASNVVLQVEGAEPIRATLASVTQSGAAVTAVYSFAPPGGAWAAGTYSIQLVGGQVTDNAGNATPPQTLGAFAIRAPRPVVARAAAVPAIARLKHIWDDADAASTPVWG